MKNSQETIQPNNDQNPSKLPPQSNAPPIQDKHNIFSFLGSRKAPSRSPSFFSHNGLSQDILKVTEAEPDTCLEVFYALYHVLWPQLENLNERKKEGMEQHRLITSLQDAWTGFIGGAVSKGILWSPEKLMDDPQDIEENFQKEGGEKQVFLHLDEVIGKILSLKSSLTDYQGEILQREEIMASLELVQEFYVEFRNKVRDLVMLILEEKDLKKNYQALNSLLEPKAMMTCDIFDHHWAFRISRKKAKKILSLNKWKSQMKNPTDDGSSHRVVALPEESERLVYFKANGRVPIQPEKEYMLYSLYRYLQIPVPETALLILSDVFAEDSDYYYAVQASEAVIGESALEACKNPETIFEQEAYAEQVIGALLTNPSDGSFKNFKYHAKKKALVGIDNDLIFEPELSDGRTINIKSILYLLCQMDLAIPESTKTFFASLDPHLTILAWLRDLSQKNTEYNLLFGRLAYQKTRFIYQNLSPQSEVLPLVDCLQQKVLVDPDLHNEETFFPQILVTEETLCSVSEKLRIIEKTLIGSKGSVSAQYLFEEISPVVGKYYRKLRLEFSDPEEALDALWGEKKGNGIDYSKILSLLSPEELSSLLSHKKLGANEKLVPDKFFDEYREKLVSGGSLPPVDRFIQRHSQRKQRNLLNLNLALDELRVVIQAGLVDSQFPRDIIEFCVAISKMPKDDDDFRKDITSLLYSLPSAELQWLLTLEKYFVRDVSEGLGVLVNGAFLKERTLVLTEPIFDEMGDINKSTTLTGRSRVACFPAENPEFYLKQYPEFPGYEFASTMFMKILGVTHLPYHDLIIINNSYPVLLSQSVAGTPVHKIWNNPLAFNKLDLIHTGLLIIAAMLINPEDGKEDNFILSPDGKYLIPIDNDHCFLPSTFQKTGNFWSRAAIPALQTKTLLFCLDEMYMPIPPEVKEKILGINFDQQLTLWMSELDKLETRFNNLVSQAQRAQFLEKGTVMKIPFYKQFIYNVHWKAHKIQSILRMLDKTTSFDLLKAIEPFAARCYEESFKQGSDLKSRFKAATSQLYTKTNLDESRFSVLNTRNMIEIINVSEADLLNDAIFQRMGPVDSLGLLEELIQERNERAGKEQELLCDLDEKNQEKKWTSLFGKPPVESALEDFFVDPKEALVLKGSKLIVSSKLRALFAMTPDQGARIKFLSLPKSPLLSHRTLRTLVEGCLNLEYLNVSGCGILEEIVCGPGEWPLLVRLEAKDCFKLEKVVSYSPLKILRIGNGGRIELFVEKSTLDILTMGVNDQFSFTIKNREHLEITLFSGEIISDVDFFRLVFCEKEFAKYFNRFVKITIGGTCRIFSVKDLEIFVKEVNLKNGNISSLAGLKLPNLTKIEITLHDKSFLRYFVQGDWPKLKHLGLSNKAIDDEDMHTLAQGNWPLLETLNLKGTGVTRKGIFILIWFANWPNFREVECVMKIDVKGFFQKSWSELEWLDLNFTPIRPSQTDVILKKFKRPDGTYKGRLEKLILRKTEMRINEIKALVNKCEWPQLKYLDVSLNTIYNNGVLIMVQADWPLLEVLKLDNTGIWEMGIGFLVEKSNWPLLKHLSLAENQIEDAGLKKLAEGKWPLLETLDLRKTWVTTEGMKTSIKKFNYRNLKHLDLSENQINDEGLEIASEANWPLLENLNLDGTQITMNGLLNFISKRKGSCQIQAKIFGIDLTKPFSQLESLNLSRCKLTVQEIDAIVSGLHWPQLRHLSLVKNSTIDDEALEVLAKGSWPLLETLDLRETNITKRGFLNLFLNANWPNLKEIQLVRDCRVVEKELGSCFFQKDLSKVETLELGNSWISLAEIELILKEYQCSMLKSLNLSDNDIYFEGLSEEALAACPLIEEFQIANIKMTLRGIEKLVYESKWSQLRFLDISNNEIFDEGLALLALGKWPLLEDLDIKNTRITGHGIEVFVQKMEFGSLKKLDVSKNEILDEGLKILASSEWPLFQHLVYYETKVTINGHIALIENDKWPSLNQLEHSVSESIHNFNQDLPENILAIVPMSNKYHPQLVIVVENMKGNSKEVDLVTDNDGWREKLIILPQEKLHQLEEISASRDFGCIPFVILPSNLKRLDLTGSSLSNAADKIFVKRAPSLEILRLKSTQISTQDFEILSNKFYWSDLKELDISCNPIQNKGLEIFAGINCPFLEELNLSETDITFKGIEVLIKQTHWPHLKKLDVSKNVIQNEGLEILTSGKWYWLESLNLSSTNITGQGIEMLISKSDWLHMKKLDLSHNRIPNSGGEILGCGKWEMLEFLSLKSTGMTSIGVKNLTRGESSSLKQLDISCNPIGDEGIKLLASGKWPELEELNIANTEITKKGIESMARISNWSNLKKLDVSLNTRITKIESLALGKWPLLECLEVNGIGIPLDDIEALINKASWPDLKEMWLNAGDPNWRHSVRGLIVRKWPTAKLIDSRESLKAALSN